QSLKAVLQYAYEGFAETGDFTPLQLLSLISLVHEYQFDELFQDSVNKFKFEFIANDNIAQVFDVTTLCEIDSILEKCWIFLEENSETIVSNLDLFSTFSLEMVNAIVLRDTFYANEIDIFNAVMAWHQ
ncbi:BTB/POZ domain-containing protein 9-like protein, partial [Dinothrombium tinctorium]